MLTLQHCTVVTDDELYHQLDDRTIVTTSGESPNATVRVAIPDDEERKYRTVDSITKASIATTPKGGYRITGRSRYLTNELHAEGDDAIITIEVTPAGCRGCKK